MQSAPVVDGPNEINDWSGNKSDNLRHTPRLLVFFPNIAPGGTERVVQTLLPELSKRYQVHCVMLANPANSPYQAPAGIPLIVLDGLALGGLPKYVSWMLQLWCILRQVKPDAVLSFGEVPIVLASLCRALHMFSQPARLIHNVRNHESTFLKQAIYGGLKKRVLAWSLRKGDCVTGNSQEIVNELCDQFHCSAPTRVIFNPVDLTRFVNCTETQNSRRQEGLHIINIARLDPQKGQNSLLRAFAQVQAQCPNARLSFIGEGPEESVLRTSVAELGLRQVNFMGWSSDIPLSLMQADIFCLPSLWEGMPNVLLEALAAGVPVVAFDCKSGPREILEDGRYGILVNVGDIDALAKALLTLAADTSLRQLYAERGLIRAKDFNTAHIAKQWIEVIEG